MPKEGQQSRELLIKHEPIPDYRDMNGEVVGMHGMTMPFYLDEGVKIDGLKSGEQVSFELSQWRKPVFKELVTSIKPRI